MSDDLVKRLRMVTGFIRFETGDRIAASACLSEEAADRIEELEAKLAKAVEALEFYATKDVTYHSVGTVAFHGHDDNGRKAGAVLAEINRGGDE